MISGVIKKIAILCLNVRSRVVRCKSSFVSVGSSKGVSNETFLPVGLFGPIDGANSDG